MKEQLLAVYGTLKRGYGNNRLLNTSEFVGEDIIKTDMTMISMGGFPGLVDTPGVKNDIHIEVFKVTSQDVAERIDGLEGYPGWYNKKEVDTVYGPAKIYFFEEGRYSINEDRIVKDGNWKPFY